MSTDIIDFNLYNSSIVSYSLPDSITMTISRYSDSYAILTFYNADNIQIDMPSSVTVLCVHNNLQLTLTPTSLLDQAYAYLLCWTDNYKICYNTTEIHFQSKREWTITKTTI